MKKLKKTRADLERMITERTGVNVSVSRSEATGWRAVAIVVPANISKSQKAVDPVEAELRTQFDLEW